MSAIDARLAAALRRTLLEDLAWPDGWDEVAERYVSHEEEDLAASVTEEEAETGEGSRLTLSALDPTEVSRIVFGIRRSKRSGVFLLLEGERGPEGDEGEIVPAGIVESPMALAGLLRRTRPAMADAGALYLLDPDAARSLQEVHAHAEAALRFLGWEVDAAGVLKQKTGGRPRLAVRQVAADLYRYLAELREQLHRPHAGNLGAIRRDVVELMRPLWPEITEERVRQAVDARR